MQVVSRSDLEGSAPLVAPWLLNKLLVSHLGGETVAGRIIEVEAYDEGDPASHTFCGRTSRNATMFGPPGHLYVYLSYGIHRCANVVVGPEGRGEAVLIRSIEVVEGIQTVEERRGDRRPGDLTNGPGKLGQAMGLDLSHDGQDLCVSTGVVRLLDDGTPPPESPLVGPRVGLTKAIDTPWRFRRP